MADWFTQALGAIGGPLFGGRIGGKERTKVSRTAATADEEYGREELMEALEAGDYMTEGFRGETAAEYREWYAGEIGTDPFELAQSLGGAEGFAGLEAGQDPSLAWIGASGTGSFDPETGRFTGIPGEGQETTYAMVEERYAERQQEEAYRQGEATMQWLLGQAMYGDLPEEAMGVGMAVAGAEMGRQFGTTDYSGIMAQRHAQEMQRAQREAGQFNFFRDLLPALVQVAGFAVGGQKSTAPPPPPPPPPAWV